MVETLRVREHMSVREREREEQDGEQHLVVIIVHVFSICVSDEYLSSLDATVTLSLQSTYNL